MMVNTQFWIFYFGITTANITISIMSFLLGNMDLFQKSIKVSAFLGNVFFGYLFLFVVFEIAKGLKNK